MNKSILRAVNFTVIAAIAVTAALVCAGCTGIEEDSSRETSPMLDGLLGVPYKIKFDSQGGSAVDSQEISLGDKIKVPAEPTRVGYTLDGWSRNKNVSDYYDKWNFDNAVTSDMTLYARWKLNEYTVRLDSQGGDGYFPNSYGDRQSLSVKYGDTVRTPSANREGYKFDGWYTDTAYTYQWKFNTDVITSDTTLYAKWTINKYTVKFESDGGGTVNSQVVEYGGKVKKPADPVREGYTFEGWGRDKNASSAYKWNFDNGVTSDMTLYALWEGTYYQVTFDLQGGRINNYYTYTQTAFYGKVTKPDDPYRTDYTFGGWYKDAAYNTLFNFTPVITSDITIYAKWNHIKYKVTFDPNGGNVTPQSDSTGEGYTLASLPTPTRTNFKFDGWFTTATGDTAVTTETRFSRNTTIYARWVGVPTPNKTTFTDSRDNRTYNKVKIGTQVWMAENLNYDADGQSLLYNWATANTACPAGWHLPIDAEWTTLVNYVGGGNIAGKKLKSVMGWNNNGNGTDEYGFSALPDGGGDNGHWWSATESNAGYAWIRGMRYDRESVYREAYDKTGLFSVRCVAD